MSLLVWQCRVTIAIGFVHLCILPNALHLTDRHFKFGRNRTCAARQHSFHPACFVKFGSFFDHMVKQWWYNQKNKNDPTSPPFIINAGNSMPNCRPCSKQSHIKYPDFFYSFYLALVDCEVINMKWRISLTQQSGRTLFENRRQYIFFSSTSSIPLLGLVSYCLYSPIQ